MEIWGYIAVAAGGLVSGVLSGISGGGAGMLMIPLFIAVGLSPQQAVATGKMNGLGAAFGGLSAFRKSGHIRMDIFKSMAPVAIVVGIATPFIFKAIDSTAFQAILGGILILLTPTLFIKRKSLATPTKKHKAAGYGAYTGVLVLQALFGSGAGSLALFVLTLLFGTTKIEANATRRAVMAVMTPLIFVALLFSGFIVLSYGIIGLVTMFTGTHIGSKIALRHGEQVIAVAMAVTVAGAGLALIATALF